MSAWPYVIGGVAIVGVGFIFYRITKMNSDVSASNAAFQQRQRQAMDIAAANPGIASTYIRNPESQVYSGPNAAVNEPDIVAVRAPRP